MLRYVCDIMYCYTCNTTNIITECNLVTHISQEGTIIQSQFMYQRYNKTQFKVNGTLFHRNTLPHPMEKVSSTIGGHAKSIVRQGYMGKNDDVIVQSSQDVAQ